MNLLDILFWLYFLLFFVAIFIAFFIPGDLILRRLPLSLFQRFVIGIILGMVLWGWQGFVFGYLGFRYLSYLYLLTVFILWVKTSKLRERLRLPEKFTSLKTNLILVVLVGIGSLIQITIVWFNGVAFNSSGLYFCCGNASDNLFHLALTNEITKHFPPFEPGMFGVLVRNYHYWSNLIVAELVRVFRLPLIATQFQYSTVFVSVFLGLSAIVFGQIIKLGKTFIVWLVLFLYFGGDLIFLLLFFLGKGLNFNMSSMEDGSKFLANPPRAFSIIVFFAGISLLILWIKKKDLRTGLLMALLLGSLIGFKVYTGIFALSGLAILGIYFLVKRNFRMLLPLIITLVISIIIYLPVNKGAGGLYLTGFWLFENFIVQPTLGLEHLELARRIFIEHRNWIRVFQSELIFFSLFVFSIFGSKLIGLLQSKKSLSLLPRELNIFLISGIIISAFTGFFFQQRSGGANTFNFLVSVFIFGSIYTSLACFYWLGRIKNRSLKWFFILLIILFTIPRVVVEWKNNINNILSHKGFIIENAELEGLDFLRKKTDRNSIVFVDNRKFPMSNTSPYISFLTDRPIFLSGLGILNSHGIDISERLKLAQIVVVSREVEIVKKVLLDNKIKYILMSAQDELPTERTAYFFKNVFQNQRIKILEIDMSKN